MPRLNVGLADIEEARRVLKKYLEPTPLLANRWLSEKLGCHVYLKLENIQPIGSFKIRGATYKISRLSKAERRRGVIAASAGNHAQGVAWGSGRFRTKATVVMPVAAPLTKIQNTQALGAKVILEGEGYDEAYAAARKIASREGLVFIHPYEDADIIAGQGTVGLEIIEQLPDVDLIIGPMGGGGLMAGVARAVKALRPPTRIIGAQASGAKALVDSIRAGKVIATDRVDTFADGIKVKAPSAAMVRFLRPLLDSVTHADDESIAAAVLTLIEKAKIVAEGSGALALAVLEKLPKKEIRGKKVVLLVSGGNIDVNLLARIIDRGLIRNGRRLRLNAYISDKPGSLNRLTGLIAGNGANVLQVIHDRDAPAVGLNETMVELNVETRGPGHSRDLIAALRKSVLRLEVLR